jgi:F-type H+-transporting ATPase subunit gamma
MPSLKEIRNRITSVSSTQQITKAMKMVAAAKLRKAQDGILQMRPYAQSLNNILSNLSESYSGEIASPFLEKREVEKVLLIVLTSDRGLCGAFNSNVSKYTLNLIQTTYQEQQKNGNLEIFCIGKKGADFFKKRGYKVVGEEFTNIFAKISFETVKKAGEFVMEAFANQEYDVVDLIYNEFKNVATQILCKEQLMPIVEENKDKKTVSLQKTSNKEYVLEPSAEEIITELIPKSLKIKLFRAILESNASEQGARMTAMEKATENAGDLLKQLRLVYNRSRQASITKEILEIVGGAEALSQS